MDRPVKTCDKTEGTQSCVTDPSHKELLERSLQDLVLKKSPSWCVDIRDLGPLLWLMDGWCLFLIPNGGLLLGYI